MIVRVLPTMSMITIRQLIRGFHCHPSDHFQRPRCCPWTSPLNVAFQSPLCEATRGLFLFAYEKGPDDISGPKLLPAWYYKQTQAHQKL